MLKQDSSVPLYQQLKSIIKDKIEKKELKPSEKIPSEAELIQEFKVSRITVRNALSELVEEGYLVKEHGKGTFVSEPKIIKKIRHRMSFTESCKEAGLKPTSVVITKEILETHASKEKLELEDNDKILHIERLRYADEDAVAIEHMYFSYKKYGFLLEEPLTGSIYKILEQKFSLDLLNKNIKNKSILSVENAGWRNGNLLNLSSTEPLFVIDAIVFDDNEMPVYVGKDYMVGSRYCFMLRGFDED